MTDAIVAAHERQILDGVSAAFVRRGLTVPGIFLLELHKPLVGVGRLAVEAFDPLLRCILGSERTEVVLELMKSPAHVEYVIDQLEQAARREKHGS